MKLPINLFISTLPRSGSTMLGMMLGAHSKICHIGESSYWAKLNPYLTKCCCGKIGCDILIKMSKLIYKRIGLAKQILTTCGEIDYLEEPNKKRHGLSLTSNITACKINKKSFSGCRHGLDMICDVARQINKKEIVVENSKYLSLARFLLNNTQNWKIIFLIRDPRGVAFSSKKAGERKNINRSVKSKINHILSFATEITTMSSTDRSLLVRYEDLCSNPTNTLKLICNFLGVHFEKRMLLFQEHKGHVLMGNRMMFDINQSVLEDLRWISQLSIAEKDFFLKDKVVSVYSKLGYDLRKNHHQED